MSGQPTNYNLTYNGYYYTGDVGENPDYLSLLEISINYPHVLIPEQDELSIQSKTDGKEGDYLLLKDTTSLSLYKYINLSGTDNESRFAEIILPNYFIFYSVNSNDFDPNSILFCDKNNVQVTISNYNSGTFDSSNTFNILFEGIGDKLENKPEAESTDLYNFFMDTDGNNDLLLYQCYEFSENNYEYITCITGLSKFSFKTTNVSPYNDRYVIYIELKELRATIIKIKFMTEEYTGYQGFFVDTTDYVLGMEQDIINKIKELKLNREIILYDTLLTKYNGDDYKIYLAYFDDDNELKVSSTNSVSNILYNDLLNLNMLYVDDDNLLNIQEGYFDQNNKYITGVMYPYTGSSNSEYYLNYEDLYGYIPQYNINYGRSATFIDIFLGLYKFEFSGLLLFFVNNYDTGHNNNYIIINKYINNEFCGYYNSNNVYNISDRLESYIKIISSLSTLYYAGSIILLKTSDEKIYTLTININNNKLVIDSNLIKQNQSFAFFYRVDNYIKSVLITNNSINDINMQEFSNSINNFNGIIGKINPEQNILGNDGDLYLNINNIQLFQYSNGIWTRLMINKYMYYFTNYIKYFEINYNNTNGSNIKYVIDDITQQPENYNLTYNGYYSENDGDKSTILNDIKGSINAGDYLLLNNSDGLSINKYDGDDWIEITKPVQFLYYSVNGDSSEGSMNKILYINDINVVVTNLEFPIDKIFEGSYGSYYNLPEELTIENLNEFYLSTDNINNILSQCYEILENNYKFIPVFSCLSRFSYIDINSLPYKNKYIIYNELNEFRSSIIKINFMEDEYSGYQGFYTETTDYVLGMEKDIINKIIELKLGRDVILNDTLLTKYNNDESYKIYIVKDISEGNENVIYCNNVDNVLYNDLLNLNMLIINNDNISINNGYFNQNEIELNFGIYPNTYNNKYYLDIDHDNEKLYIIKYNINYNTGLDDNYVVIYNNLYKFNNNNNGSLGSRIILGYVYYNKDDNNNYIYNIKIISDTNINNFNNNNYYGFYDYNTYVMPKTIDSYLNIIYMNSISSYTYSGDIILLKTEENKIYKLTVNIVNNGEVNINEVNLNEVNYIYNKYELKLNNKIVKNNESFAFLCYDIFNINYIKSVFVTYNSIQDTNMQSFLSSINSFNGIIGNTLPTNVNGNDGDL